MCCYHINTEVLLAYLFGVSKAVDKLTIDEIHAYLRFISERIPTYVCSNLSEYALYTCKEMYPELYTVYRNKEGKVVIKVNEYRPNLSYFNSVYSFGMCNYLEGLTKEYLNC